MKLLLKILKITAWVIPSAFLALLYAAFYTGFFDALAEGDIPNILAMPAFIGLFGLVHYFLLVMLNRITYRDDFFGLNFFDWLKELGVKRAVLICVPALLLGVVSCLAVILVHLYFTLVVFGILTPRAKAKPHRYTPSSYYYRPTSSSSSTSSTNASTPTTTTSSTSSTKPTVTRTAAKEYDLDSYKRFIQSSLTAATTRVDCGYSKFVRSAKVTSLSVSISGGSTPTVRVTASVTVYVNSAAARAYIGVDSHHNSTYANSNVVDSEIKDSLSRAKDSARSNIESRIRQLTRNFASANGSGPDSVNESVSVSVQKVN